MFLWNIAVTSLAEVWIEIDRKYGTVIYSLSLPLRKCGLKSDHNIYQSGIHCHFPCGSVD